MNKQATLWELLTDTTEPAVTIPMIQRDYAQGRPDKGHILGPFLKDIRDCLSDENGYLTLDFVYGNTDNKRYYPLDGQQRLTTLWLVHWYLAFRLKKLEDKKISAALKRFSYQTRNSSSDFCGKLCDEMARVDPDAVENIAKYIIGQGWFFADWLQDPTVNAMLRALGGSKAIKNSSTEENDEKDTANIEYVFRGTDLGNCWEKLTLENRITFQLMVIGTDQLPISDDLYIKMNARGKKLTDFENFKADLVAHIQKLDSVQDKLHYSTMIDVDWTDVFWNDRKHEAGFDGNIDPIFFMFINRFVLNQHCLTDIPASYFDSSKHLANDDTKIKQLQNIFNTLYGSKLGKKEKNDDSLVEYKGFDVYKPYMTAENLEKLDNIFKNLKEYAPIIQSLQLTSTDEISVENTEYQFRFLPYFKDNTLVATELKDRIYFHSICLFLEKPSKQPNRLENWLRVVRNLTENAAIESIDAMINCLRLVNRLGLYLQGRDWDIYQYIGDFARDNQSKLPQKGTVLGEQFIEELEKAAQIWQKNEMEESIKNAEAYSFFEGTIRFLYRGHNGELDWDNFETKFENAKILFPDKRVSPDTNKVFLGRFKSFDDIEALETKKDGHIYLFTKFGRDNRKNCWKKHILCRENIQQQVHDFLMGEPPANHDALYGDFLNSKAIKIICDQDNGHLYRYYYSKAYGIHRENSKTDEGLYISTARLKQNKELLDLAAKGIVKLGTGVDLGMNFLFGRRITFEYKGKKYDWYVEWDNLDKLCSAEDKEAVVDWPAGEPLVNLLPILETL